MCTTITTRTSISIITSIEIVMGRVDRAIGSTMPSTVKASLIGIRGRRKNSTGQVPTTRLSHESSFAAGRSKGGRISGAVEPVIAVERVIVAVLAGKAVLVAAAALADKVELAIVVEQDKVWVVAAVEQDRDLEQVRVTVVARASSAVVAEVAAAHLKASIAAVAPRAAPASAAAPAWEALGAAADPGALAVEEDPEVEEVEVAVAEVEVVVDAAGNYD